MATTIMHHASAPHTQGADIEFGLSRHQDNTNPLDNNNSNGNNNTNNHNNNSTPVRIKKKATIFSFAHTASSVAVTNTSLTPPASAGVSAEYSALSSSPGKEADQERRSSNGSNVDAAEAPDTLVTHYFYNSHTAFNYSNPSNNDSENTTKGGITSVTS